jgi:hypothetical protein
MTFEHADTYNWYMNRIQDHWRVAMDVSELPDRDGAKEVKFWREGLISFALGRVTIRGNFE